MVLKFDWDQWNIQKNEIKHGVSRLEAESLFFDPHLIIYKDIAHSSEKEECFVMFARSLTECILMTAFTIRSEKIRIISTRPASK